MEELEKKIKTLEFLMKFVATNKPMTEEAFEVLHVWAEREVERGRENHADVK